MRYFAVGGVKALTTGLFLSLFLYSSYSLGIPGDTITASELALLPKYCHAKIRPSDPAESKLWASRLGHDNWIHMHHYCGGLAALHRVPMLRGQEKKDMIRDALWEFDYVISHVEPTFFLQPEFHLNKGKVLRLMEKYAEALTEFQKALTLKPDLIAAYLQISELYEKINKKPEALEALKEALKLQPSNQGLRKKFQQLGGDISTLQDAPPQPPLPGSSSDVQKIGPDTAAAPVSPATPSAESSTINPPQPEVEQKIGNDKNPWCRFCVDESSK